MSYSFSLPSTTDVVVSASTIIVVVGPEVDYWLPQAEAYAMVDPAEDASPILVGRDDIDAVLGGHLQWADESQAYLPAIADELWPNIVGKARLNEFTLPE